MRYLLTVLIVSLAFTTGFSQSSEKVSPLFITPPDTLKVLPFTPGYDKNITAVPIPMYNSSVDAKILVWWPDTGIDYKMPNILTSGKKGNDLKLWDWKKQDKKEGGQ